MFTKLSGAAIEPLLLRTTTDLVERLANPCILVDRRQRVAAVNAALGTLFGLDRTQIIGRRIFAVADGLLDRPELRALANGRERGWEEVQDLELDLEIASVGRRVVTMTAVRIQADWFDVGVTLLAFQDLTRRVELLEERAALAAAIDHAANVIALTDADGTLTYANPAFAKLCGLPSKVLVGTDAMQALDRCAAPLGRGQLGHLFSAGGWSGQLTVAGARSSPHVLDVVAAPVQGLRDAVVGHVIVGLDRTRERRIAEELQRELADRAAVAHTLARVSGVGSVAEMTARLCAEIRAHPGFDAAAVLMLWGRQGVVPMAVAPPRGPIQPRRPLPSGVGYHLRRHAAAGVWVEACRGRRTTAYGRLWAEAGLSAVASLPIIAANGPVAVLVIGTSKGSSAALTRRMSPLIEFGAVATALLAEPIAKGQMDAVRQDELWQIIKRRAFDPVFQPIIDLRAGRTVGYEALTRFHDGTDPATRFEAAHEVGLGVVLEDATMRAALKAARALPPDAWLALNVSADMVLGGSRLLRLLSNPERPVVLEITEHQQIANAAELRSAAARLGDRLRTLRVAVDDAGAGFNGLRFILELAPDLIKLDRSLITRLEDDPAKRALVAAMQHFAVDVSAELVAEGVETEVELAALRSLGIRYGQGHLFGAPSPVGVARPDGRRWHSTNATLSHARDRSGQRRGSRFPPSRPDSGQGHRCAEAKVKGT